MVQYLHVRTAKVYVMLPLFLLGGFWAKAQYKISGTVIDTKNKPVRGANVYLDNTIDGGTTDSMGIFRFTTSEKGNQTLVASEIGHENVGFPIMINGDTSGIVLIMKIAAPHDLEGVTITAGSFDASNDKTKTVLKPLDIVTTAGAGADIVKAMQTLPGTQQTGTENGLFVRGGDASEAAIIVDEMVVQNAFFSGAPGVATRSRFGAFNYQGVSFSSGGYSARYGQALSSVLELNTTDMADKSTINMGANLAGVYASGVKKWKNSSLDVGGGYTNLSPFYGIVKSNFNFYKVPQGGSGNVRYVWKPNKDGILKVSLNTTHNTTGVAIPNPALGDSSAQNFFGDADTVNYVTKDHNYYSNISYKQMFKHKYSLYTAASYSYNNTDNAFGTFLFTQEEYRRQFRIEGRDFFTSRLNLLVGTDFQSFGILKNYKAQFPPNQQYDENIVAGYAELEWTPINRIAVKPGVRYEHSALLNLDKVAPRLSMAYRTGSYTQASLAGGIFYQEASSNYLLAGLKPNMQMATHYIVNWQYNHNDRILRLEGYYKQYDSLISEHTVSVNPNAYRIITPSTILDNSGYGYAQGLEVFWRDKKSVKNLDYWVSYSYIDTKRKYGNFPVAATPSFIANHNLNLVGKYFVDKWHTSISATYTFATGKPYYNPGYGTDYSRYLSDETPQYHNLALSGAYLHTFGKWFTVFYISIDNVTNQHNVFGYRYDGTGNKYPVVPALYRTVFFGVNMSLTQFSKDEL